MDLTIDSIKSIKTRYRTVPDPQMPTWHILDLIITEFNGTKHTVSLRSSGQVEEHYGPLKDLLKK